MEMEINHRSFTLDQQQFASAITFFVGLKLGYGFFPTCIIASSFVPEKEYTIEISTESKDEKIKFTEGSYKSIYEVMNTIIEISRKEMHHALSLYIRQWRIGAPYVGDQIARISPTLPDSMRLRLRLMSPGASSEDWTNYFGGIE